MSWVVGDRQTSPVIEWAPGDVEVSEGECFLLQENGGFLLQENYCRIVIHESDPSPWEIGDIANGYSDPISPGGCPVPVNTVGSWVVGDN